MCLFRFTKAEQQASNQVAPPEHAGVERQKPKRGPTLVLSARGGRRQHKAGSRAVQSIPQTSLTLPVEASSLERLVWPQTSVINLHSKPFSDIV